MKRILRPWTGPPQWGFLFLIKYPIPVFTWYRLIRYTHDPSVRSR